MNPRNELAVSFADVEVARLRVRGLVHRTPVLTSRSIDEIVGARCFFKAEIFQRIGAFKARGAFSRLTLLSAEERRCGVVAYSSGNHAQAVALAAKELGMTALIVMPRDAPSAKVEATRSYGARIVLYDRQTERREDIAVDLAANEGALLVPPFDDPAIIAGQGTAAMELLDEVRDLDAFVCPCGGGGLLSGSALAISALSPRTRAFGVEPETGDDMRQSLLAGVPVTIPVPATIADALQTTRPGELTLPIVRTLANGVLTVSDEELRKAMALLFSRMKIVVEPGGVAGFAAVLAGRLPVEKNARVGIILSGGNVDLARFAEFFG